MDGFELTQPRFKAYILPNAPLQKLADGFRDPRVWVRNEYGQWIKDNIWDHN